MVQGVIETGGGKCDLAWGGLDSYRTEAYGVLSVLGSLKGRTDNLTIWCDNLSVVRVMRRITRGGKLPGRCADVWREIREQLRNWAGGVHVKWVQGHVEKRKPNKDDWTMQEWGNHVADAIAEEMYRVDDGDMSRYFTAEGWTLWDGETPASDRLYDVTLKRIAENHIENYLRGHGGGDLTRAEWEYTKVSLGYVGASAPKRRGNNVQRVHGKIPTQKELQHRVKCGAKSHVALASKGQKHCLACGTGVEDAWHFLGTCKCAELVGHRKALFSKYDAAMLKKGGGRPWTEAPSNALRAVIKVQAGCFAATKRGAGSTGVQRLLQGMVLQQFVDALVQGGVKEEELEETLRWHGETLSSYFWEGWRIRKDAIVAH